MPWFLFDVLPPMPVPVWAVAVGLLVGGGLVGLFMHERRRG